MASQRPRLVADRRLASAKPELVHEMPERTISPAGNRQDNTRGALLQSRFKSVYVGRRRRRIVSYDRTTAASSAATRSSSSRAAAAHFDFDTVKWYYRGGWVVHTQGLP